MVDLAAKADEFRVAMETHSARIRELIVLQPPIELLGFVSAQLYLVFMTSSSKGDFEATFERKAALKKYQLVLEYLHAAWSCTSPLKDSTTKFDEVAANHLLREFEELDQATMMYCMASSATETEFHAKTSWALIRGNRYQVLEEEFLLHVLGPHDDALLGAYGVGAKSVAEGIQAVANSMRTGFADALEAIQDGMRKAEANLMDGPGSIREATRKLLDTDPQLSQRVTEAYERLFRGGSCNLSKRTSLPIAVLEDLSFAPGENSEFFAEGAYSGTPMRTLPARLKPAVRLGSDVYCTDGQFVRDSAYRAIQRGLLKRKPDYREEWNRRQKELIESSFPLVLASHFRNSRAIKEVYFPDPATGQWAESDLVIGVGDVLLVVEAKAGIGAMHSPATSFGRHERAIRDLVIKAYEQCKRFIEYLNSANHVPTYARTNSVFQETARLSLADYRVVLPIGLTVESFSPFSAMAKDLPEITPILGRYPFVSMSVDDLFVLRRFLPTAGELFHYLEVRQKVAGLPRALLFDEVDHLGAYISRNRFDIDLRDQLNKADMVSWDSFGDIVDKAFEAEDWDARPFPKQEFPEHLAFLLSALDSSRTGCWLRADSLIRDLGADGRANLDRTLVNLSRTLVEHPKRRFLLTDSATPISIMLCRVGSEPNEEEVRFHGQIGCVGTDSDSVVSLVISYRQDLRISAVNCTLTRYPAVVQMDYGRIREEAKKLRRRIVTIR